MEFIENRIGIDDFHWVRWYQDNKDTDVEITLFETQVKNSTYNKAIAKFVLPLDFIKESLNKEA